MRCLASLLSQGHWKGPLAVLVLGLGACTPAWQHKPYDAFYQQDPVVLHGLVRRRSVSALPDKGRLAIVRPLAQLLNPGFYLRKLHSPRALDINAFGHVPDSLWFTNRIGRRGYSTSAMRRGPNRGSGPARGPLWVLSGKTEGNTPGLVVRDSAGVRWVIKFDPPAFPQLSSGAEVLATKLMHAAGYFVPENHLAKLSLRNLVLTEGAETRDSYNRRIPLTKAGLEDLVTQLNPEPDGTIQALFSRFLPGRAVGPFSYEGRRLDDPNDQIRHERRRTLRALWVFYAWINNTDAQQMDTYDAYITVAMRPRRGFVRHYLIDFNGCLGSSGIVPKSATDGFVYRFDWSYTARRLLALGLYYPYWLAARRSPFRSVGGFESEVFEPQRWRPHYPNPAFDQADRLDTFWAASILARFTQPLIRAAVDTARFRESGAADWVVRTLLERRRKLLSFAFRRVAPLVLADQQKQLTMQVHLIDLGLAAGLDKPDRVAYRHRLFWDSAPDLVAVASPPHSKPVFDLSSLSNQVPEGGQRFATLEVQRLVNDEPADFQSDLRMRLRWIPDGQQFALLGLERRATR